MFILADLLVAAIILIWIISGIAADNLGSAVLGFITPIAAVLLLNYVADVPVIASLYTNTTEWVIGAIAYVVVGVLYAAFWSWPKFLRKNKAGVLDAKKAWSKSTYATQPLESYHGYQKFTAKQNKERITTWAATWPYSLTWEIIRVPTVHLWDAVYKMTTSLFDSIGKRTIDKLIEKD